MKLRPLFFCCVLAPIVNGTYGREYTVGFAQTGAESGIIYNHDELFDATNAAAVIGSREY